VAFVLLAMLSGAVGEWIGVHAIVGEFGAALASFGMALVVIDFRHDLAWIQGYVIGLKCLIIGFVFVSRGFLEWHEFRQGQQPSRHSS
jgi:hypothetical protein